MNLSTEDSSFLDRVERWLREQGEILALFRFSAAAGAKDFFLFRSPEEFRAVLRRVGPRTSVIVLRQRQLPLRGVADADLLEAARDLVPEGTEYLVLDLEPQRDGWSCHRA